MELALAAYRFFCAHRELRIRAEHTHPIVGAAINGPMPGDSIETALRCSNPANSLTPT
jgi:hypothetical protein